MQGKKECLPKQKEMGREGIQGNNEWQQKQAPPCQGFIGIGIQKPKRRDGAREGTIPLPYWNQEECKEENTPLFDQEEGLGMGV